MNIVKLLWLFYRYLFFWQGYLTIIQPAAYYLFLNEYMVIDMNGPYDCCVVRENVCITDHFYKTCNNTSKVNSFYGDG